jgi:hypothetical protein
MRVHHEHHAKLKLETILRKRAADEFRALLEAERNSARAARTEKHNKLETHTRFKAQRPGHTPRFGHH